MNVSKNGLRFIRLHEGVRNKAYLDPIGILTIGVGFTNRSNSFKEWWNRNRTDRFSIHSVMSDAEIDSALEYLISKEYGKAVNVFLDKEVPQHVFDAAVSAVFNLGPGSLSWKWATAMKQGNYKRAAELLSKTGTTAGGKVLAGLVRRRKEEAKLMAEGVYTGVKTMEAPKPEPISTPIPLPIPTPMDKPLLVRIIEMFFNLFKRSK